MKDEMHSSSMTENNNTLESKMNLSTTRNALAQIVNAVEYVDRLNTAGVSSEDVVDALAWVEKHRDAKPDLAPLGVIDLMSAEGAKVILAAWNNHPVSFGGLHDWRLEKAEKEANTTTGGVMIACLIRRMGAAGETMYTDTVNVLIDYK